MAGKKAVNPRAIVAAGYDALATEFGAWSSAVMDPAREQFFADFVERLPGGARILDVGCGSGLSWTGGLALRFAVTGIDISLAQVEAARRNVPGATFLVGDVTAMEFDRAAFDGITALFSIGHLPALEHEAVFARLARWLRPGGLLLASLPAAEDAGWTGTWISGVQMFFASLGAERYEQVLRQQGWRVLEARTCVAEEPDGAVSFLWVLAAAPTSGA
jgi:SAM-dependent methyltransferase